MEEKIKNKTIINKKLNIENKHHILVNKKINFMNRLTSNNYKDNNRKSEIKEHTNNYNTKDKRKAIESIKANRDNKNNMNINNYQFEIGEKNIIFKNTGNDNKKLLGEILSEFNCNKINKDNINNNNRFDENKRNFKDNNFSFINENRIQEIIIKNMRLKNDNKVTRHNSDIKKRKKPFELDIKDRNYIINKKENINNLNSENNFNNNVIYNNKRISSNLNYLNIETLVESVRNRNCSKNIRLNTFSYNDLFNKANTYKNFNKTPKHFDNINNINNNISLNNRYNFYIKIGKTKNELKKNNKNNNNDYEIKINSPCNRNKDDFSSNIIKKLIKNYEIDNIDDINNNSKDINIKTKQSFRKLEVQKVLKNKYINNNINKESRNKPNKINTNFNIHRTKTSTSNSFNKTNFKYLVHQASKNKNLRISFNKIYKRNTHQRIRSLSNRNNNNLFNYSNLVNNTEVDYGRSSVEKNKSNKKFKSIFNIGFFKRENQYSGKKLFTKNNINNNKYKRNINLKKNIIKNNLNDINNNKINNHHNQTQRIIHNFDYNKNKGPDRESIKQNNSNHSKENNSFSSSTLNSNFNSITNFTNMNLNMNSKNLILSPASSISTDLSNFSINLEILYVLQEKLKVIMENLKKSKKCDKASFEYINYYYNHNFPQEIMNLIKSSYNQNIIIKCLKIGMLCNFLLYDISFEEEIKNIEIVLKSIFNLLYKNFLITISFVISKYKNRNNNIIIILNKIVKDNLQNDDLYEAYKNLDESKYIKIIENNFNKIEDYYNMIVENIYIKNIDENNKIIFNDCINNINPKIMSKYKLDIVISNFFIEANKKLSDYTIETLKNFFYSIITTKKTFYKNIKQKVKSNSINNNQIHYLLPKICDHKYTLILDLDETLIYSQINFNYKINNIKNNNNKIILPKTSLILRPGLHEFLHDMKLLYELIIFSSGTSEYVDPIIKTIEKDEKYFDYILYRDNMYVDEKGDMIKNLNLIGRNLNSIIIIDDISKNFKYHKENGICIRPFCGNINTDNKTLKTLNNVLQKIRFDADETKDIRISLNKFKYLLYPVVISENE